MASTRYVNSLRVRHCGREPHRGVLSASGATMPCALGGGGIGARKREGDGRTPSGTFALRRLYFRPDRLPRPETGLETIPLRPEMGWCDDPLSGRYNRLVTLPFAASHERMWRDDHLYDLVIVIGYNDVFTKKGAGSAIFMHLARDGFAPTEGCVALRRADFLRILPRIGAGTTIAIG